MHIFTAKSLIFDIFETTGTLQQTKGFVFMVNQMQNWTLHKKCFLKKIEVKKKAHLNFICYFQKDHLGCHTGW